MRLIDADALAEHKFVGIADWTPTEATSWQRGWNDAIDTIIEAQPTVDAVEVVRCKDCKECEERHTANYLPFLYCKLNEHSVLHNAFCCWAERREDDVVSGTNGTNP